MILYNDTANPNRPDLVGTDDYLYICNVGVNSCGPGRNTTEDLFVYRPEGRRDYQLIYQTEGTCELEYQGVNHILQSGDFVLYLPGEPQKYTMLYDTPAASYYVHFMGTGAAQFLQSIGLTEGGIYHGKYDESLIDSFNKLIREFRLKRSNFRPYTASLLGVLLCKLMRMYEQKSFDKTFLSHQHKIYTFALQISQEPEKAISLKEYAADMGLSYCSFWKIFKQVMHVSPHQYIQNARMLSAKRLLISSDFSVAEIARKSGYNDPFYFSRLFKETNGCTPSEYRKLHITST